MNKIVNQSQKPNTILSMKKDFQQLGLKKGMIVLVHSSLSKIGWVNGGPVAVIEALQQVVTKEGTIVMPAHSSNWSDPSRWGNPSVPMDWWEEIKDTMPAYHPKITPTNGIGKIPEVFRNYPEVERSSHPSASFAAWGKHKESIVSDHSFDFGLGDQSPLARLYDLDAKILFIGTTYETNTAFHLGEYRSKTRKVIRDGARIMKDGRSVWETYQELEYEDEAFHTLGFQFEKEHPVTNGSIGGAESKLFSLKEAVDYSKKYFEK